MKVIKRIIALMLAISLLCIIPTQTVMAEDPTEEEVTDNEENPTEEETTGTEENSMVLETTVAGSISVTILNIRIPTSLAFSIDPNSENGATYVASKATIENNTNAPIKVLINPGNNFRQDPDSLWKPTDYLPEEKDWDKLGLRESESSLALGLKMVDKTQWRRVDREEPLYVKQQQTITEPISFGEISTKSAVEMTFTINHGFAFNETKSCVYNVIWYFTLAD